MYMYVCQIQDEAATDVEFTENADNPYMSHGYTGQLYCCRAVVYVILYIFSALFDATETVGSGKLPFPETSLFISSEQYTEGERSEHSELLK